MEGRLCPCAVSNLQTMHGSLSTKRWKQASEPTILAPTFFGRWLFRISIFWLDSFFLRSRCDWVKKSQHYSLEGSEESCMWLIIVRQMWRACFLFPWRDVQRGRIYTVWKGEQRTLEYERDQGILISEEILNTTRNNPPLVVYGWSEQGGLLGAPLSLWRHVSFKARLWVPAFAAISAEVPLRPWGGGGGLGSEVLASRAWLSRRLTRSCNRNRQSDQSIKYIKIIFLKIGKFLRVQIW